MSSIILVLRFKGNNLSYPYLYILNRCHGMMQIPYNEIGDFLQWSNLTNDQQLTLADFPMSAKNKCMLNTMDQNKTYSHLSPLLLVLQKGRITTGPLRTHICMPQRPHISSNGQWLHRKPLHEPQPEMHAIF